MIAYAFSITLLLAGLLIIVAWNLFIFRRRTYPSIDDQQLPTVSVLVPARNEERNIAACVESLLDQDYPSWDVTVLDDDSEDGTHALLERIAARDSRLRVLRGEALPDGWVGKNHACHQLSHAASGEWLLFTDADTVHDRQSVRTAILTAMAERADLLTLIPEQAMRTFSERLILPLLHFVSMTLLPFFFVENSRRPSFAIGIGQFMLFRREAYEAIGGHASVGNALVEDVWLARRIKAFGYRLVVRSGIGRVRCRMYQGFGEIWRGFSKNIFAGFNFSLPSMAAVMAMLFLLFVLPFAQLSWALIFGAAPGLLELLTVQALLILFIRMSLSVSFRLGLLSSFLHPIGILLVIAIAANSYRWLATGAGARWKGRAYRMSSLSNMSPSPDRS